MRRHSGVAERLRQLEQKMARLERERQAQEQVAFLIGEPETELRARLKDNHHQRRLIRLALKAKRRQGGQAS